MIDPMEFRRQLARIEAEKNRHYTQDQVDSISEVLMDVTLEQLREGVDIIKRTHPYQSLPLSPTFVEAMGLPTRGGTGQTRFQTFAGASKADRNRPKRLGENLAMAERQNHGAKIAYYRDHIDHMTTPDRDMAEAAYHDVKREIGGMADIAHGEPPMPMSATVDEIRAEVGRMTSREEGLL